MADSIEKIVEEMTNAAGDGHWCTSNFDVAETLRRWADRLAALPKQELVKAWNPMYSAPRDGTVVVAWWQNGFVDRVAFIAGHWRDVDDLSHPTPSLWAPDPTPPPPTVAEKD